MPTYRALKKTCKISFDTFDLRIGNTEVITEQVRTFITNNFYVADSTLLKDSDSLLDSGVIDSTGVLEIIAFIEETFHLAIEDAEVLPENLDSIAHIVAFITRKAQ